MKKVKVLGLLVLSLAVLGACSSEKNSSSNSKKVESSDVVKESAVETSETSSDFVKSAKDANFDGTVLKGNTYTIKITDHKIIQPGETGNEYGDSPVIAFWYDTLVAPDYDNSQPIDPVTSWISNFKAVQDNDPNAINELNVASLPDSKFLDSQMEEIKPGGTVQMAVAYTLTDATTPVTLIAENGLGTEFGRTDFPIQ